ncbi:hypothetical protein KIW84_063829 [Lathyrus oleraceus]|uniref:Uncharacterized protein n=1 Tax=Pisum sativum TaxID=3888 RepID=A0A9D4WAJ9_PEA|nr:hypothetical protein KIW84_063829 [Pisum sativum]
MAGDIDSRKSTLGYMIKFPGELWLGSPDCKSELGFVKDKSTLFVYSQTAIHLGKNLTFHNRSKHFDVRYHWIHGVLDAKLLELAKFHTGDNGYDMMTKALPRGEFEACCDIVGFAISST